MFSAVTTWLPVPPAPFWPLETTGAVAVTPRVWEPFWDRENPQMFHHGLTYSGHAAACAAALANLDILEDEDLAGAALALEGELAATVAPLADSPLVREVRTGAGLLAGVQMEDPAHAAELAETCLDAGVILRPIANGTLQISPPLTVEAADLDLLGDVLSAEIDRARRTRRRS